MARAKFDTVDEYVASFPEPCRGTLQTMRQRIKAAAPDADEVISYGICGYKQHGMLVYIGGARKHVALYAISDAIKKRYAAELAPYSAGDSTLRMPLDEPMPAELVTKLVQARLAENEARARARKKR